MMKTLAHIAIIGLICYLLYRAMQQFAAPSSSPDASGGGVGGQIDNIMQAIFNVEGAGRRDRNNNPGNLTAPSDSYWNGQTGRDGKFAVFGDIGDGWTALQKDITNWANANPDGDFYDFFAHYAPAKDKNNPDAYAETVADYVGVDPTTPLSQVV